MLPSTKHSWGWFFLALLLVVGLRIYHLPVLDRSPDEEVYRNFARAISIDGLSVIPRMTEAFLQEPSMWTHASPVRFGYPLLMAVGIGVSGMTLMDTGVAISFLASILSAFLIFWIALRFFNRGTAFVALILFAFSAMDFMTFRRVWADELTLFLTLILIWRVLEYRSAVLNRQGILVSAAITGLCLMLVKEIGVVVYFFVLWPCLLEFRKMKLFDWVIILCAPMLTGAIWIYMAGGWEPWRAIVKLTLEAWSTNPFVVAHVKGNFFQTLWFTAPFVFILFCIGTIWAGVHSWRMRQVNAPLYLSGIFILLVILCTVAPLMTLPRYLTPVMGAYWIVAGWGFVKAFEGLKRSRGVLIVAALFFMVMDYKNFTIISKDVQEFLNPTLEARSIYSLKN